VANTAFDPYSQTWYDPSNPPASFNTSSSLNTPPKNTNTTSSTNNSLNPPAPAPPKVTTPSTNVSTNTNVNTNTQTPVTTTTTTKNYYTMPLADILADLGVSTRQFNQRLEETKWMEQDVLSLADPVNKDGRHFFWADTLEYIGTVKPTRNDIRAHLGKPPVEGGGDITIPITTTPSTTTPNTTKPKLSTPSMPKLNLSNVGGIIPYQQELEDWLQNLPSYTPLTDEEILSRANTYADLQIDPQIQALSDAIERARLDYASQQDRINAAYTSAEDRTSRLLAEAAEEALKSSIARGMSRSGAVEESTVKQQAPVLEALANLNATQTAALEALVNQLSLAEQQYNTNLNNLATRRGSLASQYAQTLYDANEAQMRQDWQAAFEALTLLSSMVSNQSNTNEEIANQKLPYITPTADQIDKTISDITNTLGTTVDLNKPPADSPLRPVRDYANSLGMGDAIGYEVDAAGNRFVIINGQYFKINSDNTWGNGGKMIVNGDYATAYLPQNILDALLNV
jgi:hypothetical protein